MATNELYKVDFDLSETVYIKATSIADALEKFRQWTSHTEDGPCEPSEPDGIHRVLDCHGVIDDAAIAALSTPEAK